MVDRYKKSGGFVQLLQVIETCGQKKREQFMTIITEESPNWADALNQKILTYEKITGWRPEFILEIIASVNMLSFSTALKGMQPTQLTEFLAKLSHQERSKIERILNEINPSPNEIASSQMKVISETRGLFVNGSLKADKIDPNLVIPDDYEILLEKGQTTGGVQNSSINVSSTGSASNSSSNNQSINDIVSAALNLNGVASNGLPIEVDKLQKKLVLLTKELQQIKQENAVMKDKLDKIKRIA